jgi:hypothetical protein
MSVSRSLALFAVAGVCEIGGGWLVWKSLRDGMLAWWGLAGAVIPPDVRHRPATSALLSQGPARSNSYAPGAQRQAGADGLTPA